MAYLDRPDLAWPPFGSFMDMTMSISWSVIAWVFTDAVPTVFSALPIDFDGLRVTVARTATQPTPGKIYFKPPKTKAGERTISMLAPTAMLLRAQRGRVSEWRIKAGDAWADNDLVFSTPVGEVLHIEQLSRSAGQIRDKAGVSRDVLPLHGQRHYALTELHRSGVDVLTMQARAGHTDIRSTQVYVTVDADKDREAAEKAAGSLV